MEEAPRRVPEELARPGSLLREDLRVQFVINNIDQGAHSLYLLPALLHHLLILLGGLHTTGILMQWCQLTFLLGNTLWDPMCIGCKSNCFECYAALYTDS